MLLPLFLVLPLLPAAVRPAPVPAPASVRDDEVAARIDDVVISKEDYGRFLVEKFGREPLQELIDRHLLAREAERLEITVTEAEVEAAVENAWQSFLQRARGDEEALIKDVERNGFTLEEYRNRLRGEARDELLAQALCLATRVITEEDLRARYARDYGDDGNRVEVRHLFMNPARLRADLIAEGVPTSKLSSIELDRRLRAAITESLERIRAGEDFAAVAAETSHDIAAPITGGALANYDYRAYGEPFANAVRAAEVGVPVGPVKTTAGYHVIEVTARTYTSFEEAEAALRETLTTEPADYAEVEALRERLRAAVKIETY